MSPVSDRCVYGGVAEVSVYVHPDHQRKGIGLELLNKLAKHAESNGLWTLQAGVFKENQASINLHQKAGYRIVGTRERLGQLKGTWHDVVLMEKRSKSI